MNRTNERSIRALAEEYHPLYRRLYAIACAVAGNDRAAERALVRVMLSYPAEEADKAIVRCAREAGVEMGGEVNYSCLMGGEEFDSLGDRIACLEDEVRRVGMLRFGVGLSIAEIAQTMQIPVGKIKRDLRQILAETAKNGQSDDPERILRRMCIREIDENEMAPDWNTLIRAAEKESACSSRPGKRFRLRRTANWLTAAAALIVLGIMIWCCVVLLDYFRQTQTEAVTTNLGAAMMFTEDVHARV